MSKHETIKPIESDTRQRSPARAALAVAIKEANSAKQTFDATNAAIARARAAVDDAERRFADATADVEKTKAAQAERAARAAISGSNISQDRSTRTARAFEQDCLDDLEAAKSALTSVEAALSEPRYFYDRAQKQVGEAAQAVLRESVESVISEVIKYRSGLNAAMGKLAFLIDHGFDGFQGPEKTAATSHLSKLTWDISPSNPAVPPWRSYLDKLMVDADEQPPSN